MIKIAQLSKKTALTASLTLALFTCLTCSASQDLKPAGDSGVEEADPDKTAVLNKMSPKEQIEFSKQDLASRLGLGVDAIKVSGATSVNWRSGALGCPKPGVNYMDVLVPGVRIILRVDNAIYRYHAIPNGQPFYCPNDLAESPAVGQGAD
ncbi:MAG: hypothetical protein QNK19_12400 [Xanthomonadales bacterium]|nr:hypothetical protein [Xanthomonadales bacterium]